MIMKKNNLSIIALLMGIILFIGSCTKDDGTNPKSNDDNQSTENRNNYLASGTYK